MSSFLNRLRGRVLAVMVVLSLGVTLLGATTSPASADDPAPGTVTFEVGGCGEETRDLYPVTMTYVDTSGGGYRLYWVVTRQYTDEKMESVGLELLENGGSQTHELALVDWFTPGFPHGTILLKLTAVTDTLGDKPLPGFSSIVQEFNLPKCGSDPIPGPTGGPGSLGGKPTAKLVKKRVNRHEVKLAVVRLNARALEAPGVTTFKVRVRKLNARGVARSRTAPVKVTNGRTKLVPFKHLKRGSKLVVRVKGKVIYQRVL